MERVWIYKNITTTNSSALAASSFNAAPPTPTSLGAALQADNSIILNWPNVGTAETYAVERSEDAGNTYTEVNSAILGGTTSYIDGLTAPIKTYLYRILAKNTFGQSGYTATGSSTATAAPVSMLAIPGVIAPVRGAIPVQRSPPPTSIPEPLPGPAHP